MEDLQQPEEAGANLLVDWSVALTAVRASLGELKGYCLEYPFESPEEEIWFFKTGKPRFYQWLIFYGE